MCFQSIFVNIDMPNRIIKKNNVLSDMIQRS